MVILDQKEEIKNILDILYQTRNAIKLKDIGLLRILSDRTIHGASIYKDVDSVSLAVIIYSLSKLTGRTDYYEQKSFVIFLKNVSRYIEFAIENIKQKKYLKFHNNLRNITLQIDKIDGKLKQYVQDVFREARINKASRLYEHGLSREETANLLGITMWELNEYVGKTGIEDVNYSITFSEKERLNIAKKLFK